MLSSLRESFAQAGFLEIETSVALTEIAPEEYIECMTSSDGKFLRTSPELAMKNLLARGFERICQFGVCYREGEFGRRHRGEFTMLEYYMAHTDYEALRDFTTSFLRDAAIRLTGGTKIVYAEHMLDLGAEPEVICVADAFERYAGKSVEAAERDDDFDELMALKIEPRLGWERLTYLTDYPVNRASLSRIKSDNPKVAERWELYLGALELANAFGELTDAAEQKARFAATMKFREAHGMKHYPETTNFFHSLEKGLPESSGAAMGVDRLAMIFCDEADIAMVRAEEGIEPSEA